MHKPGVTIPIIGARNASQMEDSIKSISVNLSNDQIDRLDVLSAVELGFPHDFLQGKGVRDVAFGGDYEKINNHRI